MMLYLYLISAEPVALWILLNYHFHQCQLVWPECQHSHRKSVFPNLHDSWSLLYTQIVDEATFWDIMGKLQEHLLKQKESKRKKHRQKNIFHNYIRVPNAKAEHNNRSSVIYNNMESSCDDKWYVIGIYIGLPVIQIQRYGFQTTNLKVGFKVGAFIELKFTIPITS